MTGLSAMAVVVGVIAAVGLGENLVVQTRGALACFPGIPVGGDVPPLRGVPPAEGESGGIRWWTLPDGRIGWVIEQGEIGRGLRGAVRLGVRTDGRVTIESTWTPRWTLIAAPLVLAALGAGRGEGVLAGTLGVLVSAAFLYGWATVAPRVVLAVRQAWIVAAERDDSWPQPSEGQGGRPS